MQLINRGTVESRLRVLRFALILINVLFATVLIASAVMVWVVGIADVKDKVEDVDYSMGDYLGVIGSYLIGSIAIVLVVSLVIYFAYAYFLKRSSS